MLSVPPSSLKFHLASSLLLLGLITFTGACGPNDGMTLQAASSEQQKVTEPNVLARLIQLGPTDEIDETKMEEIFDKRKEEVKFFLGDYKDAPDPDFSQVTEIKAPNQEDIESLLTYLRKYVDSLYLGSPDADQIRIKIFMDEEGKIDLNALLHKFGFKPEFRDISFSVEKLSYDRAKGVPGLAPVRYMDALKNIKLDGAIFDSVKMDNLDLSGSKLSNIKIVESTLNRSLCMNCTFDAVSVEKSNAKDADFSFSKGDLSIIDSHFSYLKITDSNFNNLSFDGGTLTNSVFINGNRVGMSGVDEFNNILDNDTSEKSSVKNIGLVYKDSFPGGTASKIYEQIRLNNFQPIKIEYGIDNILIDPEAIQKEIEILFDHAVNSTDSESVANQMLHGFDENPEGYPQMAIIQSLAQSYVDRLDGLIIPGGLDVEPYFDHGSISAAAFYDDQRTRLKGKKDIIAEEFPIRTALELFLVHQAKKKGLPLLMICRGAHLYSLIKNGSIIENLPDVYDNVDFSTHRREILKADNLSSEDAKTRMIELFNKEGKGYVVVYGNHHQAINPYDTGNDIRTLLVWKMPDESYIPYALYDASYKPGAWLTQFHPEVKDNSGGAMSRTLSNFNTEVFDSYFELVQKSSTKAQEHSRPTKPSSSPKMPKADEMNIDEDDFDSGFDTYEETTISCTQVGSLKFCSKSFTPAIKDKYRRRGLPIPQLISGDRMGAPQSPYYY